MNKWDLLKSKTETLAKSYTGAKAAQIREWAMMFLKIMDECEQEAGSDIKASKMKYFKNLNLNAAISVDDYITRLMDVSNKDLTNPQKSLALRALISKLNPLIHELQQASGEDTKYKRFEASILAALIGKLQEYIDDLNARGEGDIR